jgi:hypothetical protein
LQANEAADAGQRSGERAVAVVPDTAAHDRKEARDPAVTPAAEKKLIQDAADYPDDNVAQDDNVMLQLMMLKRRGPLVLAAEPLPGPQKLAVLQLLQSLAPELSPADALELLHRPLQLQDMQWVNGHLEVVKVLQALMAGLPAADAVALLALPAEEEERVKAVALAREQEPDLQMEQALALVQALDTRYLNHQL